MSRHNNHMNRHFEGCFLLMTGRDEHRGRDVKVFVIPGEIEVVGLSDGVDAWIGPLNAIGSSLLSLAKSRLEQHRAGTLQPQRSGRVQLALDLGEVQSTGGRVRLLVEEDHQTKTPRRTLNVI